MNATSSEHTLNPQTPRVKREPLLRIRGNLLSAYLKGITWNNHPLASIFYGFLWIFREHHGPCRVPGSTSPGSTALTDFASAASSGTEAMRQRARTPQTAPRPRLPRSPARRGMALTKASKRKEQVIFEGKLDENWEKLEMSFILEELGKF